MPENSQSCPKCGGQMSRGFVLERSYGVQFASVWAVGEPPPSFWSGTKTPDETYAIGVFRCTSCGFLESYTRAEFAMS